MIIYFTGTGNSRFVAEKIAALTADKTCDAAEFTKRNEGGNFEGEDRYLFVAPTYAAAPPLAFLDFIKKSTFTQGRPAYFVITCAGGMGGSPSYCKKAAEEKGLTYFGTNKVVMPQNYLIYFKIKTDEENKAILEAALPVIREIADCVLASTPLPDPKMKAWEKVLTPVILKPYYKWFISAKAFRATDECVGCGKCVAVCPLGNVSLVEKKPQWGTRCTHCMGCIDLCPKNAIEYGKKTKNKPRYHGPNGLL